VVEGSGVLVEPRVAAQQPPVPLDAARAKSVTMTATCVMAGKELIVTSKANSTIASALVWHERKFSIAT
jgi:hypothetical protein